MSDLSESQPPRDPSIHILLVESALKNSIERIMSDQLIEILKHDKESIPYATNRIFEIIKESMDEINKKFCHSYEERLKITLKKNEELESSFMDSETQKNYYEKKQEKYKKQSKEKTEKFIKLQSELSRTIHENVEQLEKMQNQIEDLTLINKNVQKDA